LTALVGRTIPVLPHLALPLAIILLGLLEGQLVGPRTVMC
jgi:hypothetical protein